MQVLFITQDNPKYQQAIDLRISCFFSGFNNAVNLIHDQDEKEGLHLIALDNNTVVGAGRLNFKQNKAIISQMAILKGHQGKGIGSEILIQLIEKAISEDSNEIILSARTTALKFYEKHGFKTIGAVYNSSKTGIPHQKMNLRL